MRVATVKIKNDTTGQVMKVNMEDWVSDLGKSKFAGWSRLSERHNNDERFDVVVKTSSFKASDAISSTITSTITENAFDENTEVKHEENDKTKTNETEKVETQQDEKVKEVTEESVHNALVEEAQPEKEPIPTYNISQMGKADIIAAAKKHFGVDMKESTHLLTLRREFSSLVGVKK